jgi:hypothetical protein
MAMRTSESGGTGARIEMSREDENGEQGSQKFGFTLTRP